MPDKFENLSVVMYRTGKAGCILFTLLDSFASSLRDQPVKVEVNYQWGYTRLGMGDRSTPMILATELWTLTHNEWQIYPKQANETRADGTVCHDTFGTADEFQQMCIHEFAIIPEKYLIAAFRGSSINSQLDRGRLLQYSAWTGRKKLSGPLYRPGLRFSRGIQCPEGSQVSSYTQTKLHTSSMSVGRT
jgi:hypothetical protein